MMTLTKSGMTFGEVIQSVLIVMLMTDRILRLN